MNENKWRKLRKIRIKPISIVISIIVLLAFLRLTASGNEKEEETEIIKETGYNSAASIYSVSTAGITKELAAAAVVSTAQEPEVVAEIGETEEEPETYNANIPVSKQYQEWFTKYSIMYDCPLAFAYGTADAETGFTMSAVGAAGEHGIMQIYPGKNGRYFEEFEKQIGIDPASEEGNIACGCYLLGNYLNTYGDIERAAMAYNLGINGAIKLWERGIYSTKYSQKVKAAYEKWCAVLQEGA